MEVSIHRHLDKTKSNGEHKLDPSAARQIIEAQQRRRVDRGQRAFERALQRHNCFIVREVIITGTQIQATIRILPRPA